AFATFGSARRQWMHPSVAVAQLPTERSLGALRQPRDDGALLHFECRRIMSAASEMSRAIQSVPAFVWLVPYPVCTRIVRTPALRPHAISLALSPIKKESRRSR